MVSDHKPGLQDAERRADQEKALREACQQELANVKAELARMQTLRQPQAQPDREGAGQEGTGPASQQASGASQAPALASALSEVARQQARLGALEADLAAAEEGLSSLRLADAHKTAEMRSLKADLTRATTQLALTRKNLSEAQTALALAQNELGTVKRRLEAAELEAQRSDESVATLQQALLPLAALQQQQQQGQQPAEVGPEAACEQLRAQVAHLQHRASAQADQLTAAANDASDKAADAASLRETLAARVAQVSELSQKLAEARKQAELQGQQLAERDWRVTAALQQHAEMSHLAEQHLQVAQQLQHELRNALGQLKQVIIVDAWLAGCMPGCAAGRELFSAYPLVLPRQLPCLCHAYQLPLRAGFWTQQWLARPRKHLLADGHDTQGTLCTGPAFIRHACQ